VFNHTAREADVNLNKGLCASPIFIEPHHALHQFIPSLNNPAKVDFSTKGN